jgi:fucose permease
MTLLQPMMVAALLVSGMGVAVLGSVKVPLARRGIAVLSAVVLSRSPLVAVATVLTAGLIFGPIFPTIMAVLLGHFDSSVHGRAVGLFFAIGGIGWTTIPALIGAYARRTSVQHAFTIAVAAAVGLSVVSLLLVYRLSPWLAVIRSD